MTAELPHGAKSAVAAIIASRSERGFKKMHYRTQDRGFIRGPGVTVERPCGLVLAQLGNYIGVEHIHRLRASTEVDSGELELQARWLELDVRPAWNGIHDVQ